MAQESDFEYKNNFESSRFCGLDLDLGSGHMAYRHLYLNVKLRSNRKKKLLPTDCTDVRASRSALLGQLSSRKST